MRIRECFTPAEESDTVFSFAKKPVLVSLAHSNCPLCENALGDEPDSRASEQI